MSLASWDLAFSSLSLAVDGDDHEKEAVRCGVLQAFPNYEPLWKLHVAPATLRPAGITLRPSASKAMASFAQVSHEILWDLFKAAQFVDRVQSGDVSNVYENALEAIGKDGNSIQKFTNIQETIEAMGMEMNGCALPLWSKQTWKDKWAPRREKWILYRNDLTHSWRPAVAEKAGTLYMIHPNHLTENMTWQEQETLLQTSPSNGAPLGDVCELVHKESIAWLNDAYGDLISFLAPLRTDSKYQRLWGWDLSKSGSAAWHTTKAPPTAPLYGPQGPVPSKAN